MLLKKNCTEHYRKYRTSDEYVLSSHNDRQIVGSSIPHKYAKIGFLFQVL